MTIIRQRAGTIPAADTLLPMWNDVFPNYIDPLKLLVGDDLKGADVALNNSAPTWDETGDDVLWVSAGHTRKADGAARTSLSGRQTATIDLGIANMRVLLTIDHPTLNTDNPALIFRYSDASNYWFFNCDVQNAIMRLVKKVAGSDTTVATTGAPVDGGVYEVTCVGNVITAYIDGIQITTATDAALNTATKAGFHELSASSPARFSNFMGGSV